MFDAKKIQRNIEKLRNLSPDKWDKICKNCGLCCLTKVEDDGQIYYSNYACKHFDLKTKKCKCYDTRTDYKGCQKLELMHILQGRTIPDSCAYAQKIFGPAAHPSALDWKQVKNIASLSFEEYDKIVTDVVPSSVYWSVRHNFPNREYPGKSFVQSIIFDLKN